MEAQVVVGSGSTAVDCGASRTFHGRSSGEARGSITAEHVPMLAHFYLQKLWLALLAATIPTELESRASGVK